MEQAVAPVTQSTVSTAPANLVGFGPRLLASIADGLLLGVLIGITGNVTGNMENGYGGIIGALYSVLLWVNWNGQTLGKKVMGIKVVREDGKPLGYPTAIIRYIGYYISGLFLFIGFLWVIWDPKKQGFHDKIAKTYVVKA